MIRIAISCGHNTIGDVGASGFIQEDVVTWRVGQRLATYLAHKGYDSLVCNPSRDTPTVRESLRRRIQTANGWNPQLYVSIHCNAFNGVTAKGTEVYYFPGNETGLSLAAEISDDLADIYKTTNRGAKVNRNFMELRDTNCTAILVELAFVTNKADATALANSSLDDQVCEAIYQSIQKNIGRSDNSLRQVELSKVSAPNHVALEASTFDATVEQPSYDVFHDYTIAIQVETD